MSNETISISGSEHMAVDHSEFVYSSFGYFISVYYLESFHSSIPYPVQNKIYQFLGLYVFLKLRKQRFIALDR